MEFRELVVCLYLLKVFLLLYLHQLINRHCCLYCIITHDQMKVPLHERGRYPARTLQSLRYDYQQFCSVGHENLKNAKNFNNVIGSQLFDIPLSQVKCIIYVVIALIRAHNTYRQHYLDFTFPWVSF